MTHRDHRFAGSEASVVIPTMCWCSVSNCVCGHIPLVCLPLSTALCTSYDRLAQACYHIVPHYIASGRYNTCPRNVSLWWEVVACSCDKPGLLSVHQVEWLTPLPCHPKWACAGYTYASWFVHKARIVTTNLAASISLGGCIYKVVWRSLWLICMCCIPFTVEFH